MLKEAASHYGDFVIQENIVLRMGGFGKVKFACLRVDKLLAVSVLLLARIIKSDKILVARSNLVTQKSNPILSEVAKGIIINQRFV